MIADEETVKKHNLKPLARLVGYHVSGCDPKIMGIGPVPAIQNLLRKSKLDLKQIDLVDVCSASSIIILLKIIVSLIINFNIV